MKSKIKNSSNSLSLSILVSLLLSSFALVYLKKSLFYITYFHQYIPYGDLYFFILILGLSSFTLSNLKFPEKINRLTKLILSFLFFIYLFFLAFHGAFDPIFHDYAYKFRSNLYTNPLILISSIFITLLIIYFFDNYKKVHQNVLQKIITALTIILITIISYFIIFNELSYQNNHTLNLSIVLMPIINNIFGAYPPIDAQSQYGYYSYFFYPFLKIFGANLTTISSIFALLFAFCFLSIFIHIIKLTKNSIIGFIVIATSIFLNTNIAAWWPGRELYLQYRPIRMIAPCILVFSLFNYFNNPSIFKRRIYLFIFALMIIWNVDSGLPSFAVFMTADFINNLFQQRRMDFKYFSMLISESIIILLIVFFIFEFYIFLNTGKFVTGTLFFEPHLTWANGKHYFHYWSFGTEDAKAQFNMFSALIYSVGICVAIFYGVKNKWDIDKLSLFVLALLGFSISTYGSYQSQPAIMVAYILPVVLINFYIILKKENSLYIFRFLIIFLTSFLAIIFLIQLNFNKDIKNYATYLDILNPKINNKKILWYEYDGNADNIKKHDFNKITVSDLKINKNLIDPPWVIKAKILNNYEKINCSDKKNILILSMHDYYLNLSLECKNSFRGINVPHYEVYRQWEKLISLNNEKFFDFIIIDDTKLLESFDKENYRNFLDATRANYELDFSRSTGYDWDFAKDEWSESNLYIFKK